MAEAFGTALAVVGFLGQLFDGCVKAYGYFTAAANLDVDSQKLLCKIRIEEMRLVVWGREWGVSEGKFDEHLQMSGGERANPQLKALAEQILRQLLGVVTDFKKLQDRYGLLVEEGAGSGDVVGGGGGNGKGKSKKGSASSTPSLSPSGTGLSEDGKKVNGSRSSTGLDKANWAKQIGLRTKWVIGDKEKFNTLLKDLKDFNDGLEALFPPSQVPSFQRAWTHQLLEHAERDLTKLSLLENASDGVYPKLTASANLKKLRINLDSKPQASFKPTFALKVNRDAIDIPKEDARRCRGRHVAAGDVVIEWVDYDREDIDERVAHVRRMDDLARMMHSASECHPDLHSIDCLGYTDDKQNNRYGLVYKAPQPSFSTLHALIASPDLKTPDLNDRVRLAKTLAVALWSLHSLDWLHKSLCSANILFFPSAFSTSANSPIASTALVPDISHPYLIGFDASRPELDAALSLAPRNPSIADLHRHPAALRRGGPYRKPFDIYSLGLTLLEIGLWKVLENYYKPHYSAERWRDRVVLAVLVPGLGSKVGRRYREVVELCLRAEEGVSGCEAGAIMETVVGMLESIRV